VFVYCGCCAWVLCVGVFHADCPCSLPMLIADADCRCLPGTPQCLSKSSQALLVPPAPTPAMVSGAGYSLVRCTRPPDPYSYSLLSAPRSIQLLTAVCRSLPLSALMSCPHRRWPFISVGHRRSHVQIMYVFPLDAPRHSGAVRTAEGAHE
jgi:hypothetical protein